MYSSQNIFSIYTHELNIFPRLFESLPPPAQPFLHVLISFDLAGQTVLRQREVSQHVQVCHHPGPGLAVHLLSSQPGLLCLHLVQSFLPVRVLLAEALVLPSQLRHLRRQEMISQPMKGQYVTVSVQCSSLRNIHSLVCWAFSQPVSTCLPDMRSKDHIVHDILPDETADILHPLHGSLVRSEARSKHFWFPPTLTSQIAFSSFSWILKQEKQENLFFLMSDCQSKILLGPPLALYYYRCR